MISKFSRRMIEGASYEVLCRMYREGVLLPHAAHDRQPLTMEEQQLIHARLDAMHEREKQRAPMAEQDAVFNRPKNKRIW